MGHYFIIYIILYWVHLIHYRGNMKSSGGTEFYHNGLKPFLLLLQKKSPKNIANSLLCGTEIQCFNAVRAQHSDLDIAGRETTLQKDRYTVVFHPWRGLCPPCSQHCGNCCCPNAHTHQPFKPRFCCLGTP